MSELIDVLRHEHENIAKLLRVLEEELKVFDAADQPDYELFEAVAEYFVGFPDRCHHPKEDFILEKMGQEPRLRGITGKLRDEHLALGELAHDFRAAVRYVLKEVEVPRSTFHRVVANFIDRQRRHMELEEEIFFPAALHTLSAEDWQEIHKRMENAADPLFGSEAEYGDLQGQILSWKEGGEQKRSGSEQK